MALPRSIRRWVLWLGARGGADYRRLARPWADWSSGIQVTNDTMRSRAGAGRERIANLKVPPRFAADHGRLTELLEPTMAGPQEERLRVAVERRAEAEGLAERMQAAAGTDDEQLYTAAVTEELEHRHSESIAMYDEWERVTQRFIKQLDGMSLPSEYQELHSGLTTTMQEFLGQVVRQRAALRERDYIKLGEEAVEWASVNARLEQLREQLVEKSPLKEKV